ncbi:DNA repair protein rad52 [Binucleata daphniae]
MESKNIFTTNETKEIQKRLNKKLGPELISYRTGFSSTKLSYVEGWLVIQMANKIFGFNGWSSKIKKMVVEYCDKTDKGYCIGVSCVVRVKLKDNTKKEDVGFGSAENQKVRSLGYEKAKKEAATDALKRALRQFGNALGNCLYDKQFIKDVQKIEKRTASTSAQNLYRIDDVEDFDENSVDFTISDDRK